MRRELPPHLAVMVKGYDAIPQQKREIAGQPLEFLSVKTGNEWLELAKTSPIPEMLFSEFWHEGELCVLFSDSNLGKSILSVQIADSISKGQPIPGFKLEAKRQPVLYFDFELNPKQFEARYSVKNEALKTFEHHYSFDDNFRRGTINTDAALPNGCDPEEHLIRCIEKCIMATRAKVLIIDNITYLKTEMEQSKNALPLIHQLKALKSKYGLSILALAHTPKRDLSRPISQNDMQGSKMIFNFIDSCFAIGQSTAGNNTRYIKQIKARNTAIIYDTENVIVCRLDKHVNFLAFEFVDHGIEREHLKQLTDKDQEGRTREALDLKKQGLSNIQIAKQFGVSEGAIRKWLKKETENV